MRVRQLLEVAYNPWIWNLGIFSHLECYAFFLFLCWLKVINRLGGMLDSAFFQFFCLLEVINRLGGLLDRLHIQFDGQ